MMRERQHEVIKDATLTFAHILKNQLPANLEKNPPIECVFDVPDAKRIQKAHADGKILLSVILIDVTRSTLVQTHKEPIIREEDENGNVVEYKMGSPTFIQPRYLVTPWTGDPLEDQVVIGLIMKVFFARGEFMPEDIQGNSISADEGPMIMLAEQFNLERQVNLWQSLGHPFRPSVVYGITLLLESMQKSIVRRVKERVLDFKKLEG